MFANVRKINVWQALLVGLLFINTAFATSNPVVVLKFSGGIGPATADFIQRGIAQAKQKDASLVVLQLDTPGGLDKSMRTIVKSILASPVPVATFVAPSGARAASAGTYILYASHIAAMSPGTNLGAATPVQLGGGGGLPTPSKPDTKKKAPAPSKTLHKKIVNDASAYIRSLARLRNRNEAWAEKAVRESASLAAQEALKDKVIDLVATDINDLLKKVDGRTVKLSDRTQVIKTQPAILNEFKPDWRVRLLTTITDPSVAYILLLLGIYGLFFEFVNPGFVVPGVVGGIALLIALYALQLLPISYAGLGLILLGIIFMIAEAFVSSFGALGIGGVVAFVAGSVLLLEPGSAAWQLPWTIIITATVLNALFFLVLITTVIRSRQRRVVIGQSALIDKTATALEDFQDHGNVRVAGEVWQAHCETPVKEGAQLRVVEVHGLILTVEPLPHQGET